MDYARSNFGTNKTLRQVFNAQAQVRNEVTDSSVIELLMELDN